MSEKRSVKEESLKGPDALQASYDVEQRLAALEKLTLALLRATIARAKFDDETRRGNIHRIAPAKIALDEANAELEEMLS